MAKAAKPVVKAFRIPMIVELPVFVYAESRKQALEIAKKDITATPEGQYLQIEDYLPSDQPMKVGDYSITGDMRWMAPAGWTATPEDEE